MILCNIRHTESVRGSHENCPRASCGPRASVWTTLVYDCAKNNNISKQRGYCGTTTTCGLVY